MLFLESNLRNVLFQFRSDGAANFWNQFYFHIKQESRLYFKDFLKKYFRTFAYFFQLSKHKTSRRKLYD